MRNERDFVRFSVLGKWEFNVYCSTLGVDWPPPQHLRVHGTCFELEMRSQLSDEEIARMDGVARGALYNQFGTLPDSHDCQEPDRWPGDEQIPTITTLADVLAGRSSND